MTQPPVENLGERMRTEETIEMGETGNGAPTHVMPESCQYWDYTNNLFYISLGGGVWQLVGGAGGGVPSGIIAMWSGAIVNIPTGWTLCDGTAGAPDLRDRFIVGAGAAYVVGATGGAATNNLAHTHGGGTLTTTINTHSHGIRIPGVNVAWAATGTDFIAATYIHDHQTPTLSDSHSHTIASGVTSSAGSAVQENRPPYYALAFIMRL